jgi:putative peptidoglycan lipid II flippase
MRELATDSLQIGKAGTIIFLAVFLDKVLAVAKEILVARRFGVSYELDVFNIAMVLPGVIVLVLSSAFVASLVPMYTEWRQYSFEKANEKSLSILYGNVFVLSLLTILAYFTVPYIFPLFGYGFEPEQVELGIQIQRWLILLFAINAFGITFLGLMQARKQFFHYSSAPLFINITLILFLLVGDNLGIYALVCGFLLGTFFKIFYLAVNLIKSGFRFFPLKLDPSIIKSYYSLALPMIGSEMIATSNLFVDQVMATQLETGSVSSLIYAFRIYSLPSQLIIVVIVSVLLPYLSQSVSRGDFDGLRNMFKNTVVFTGFVSFPIIALFLLFSNEIVSILLERGAFDAKATFITSGNLYYYSFGIFFQAFALINGSFLIALKNTRPLIFLASLSFVLNILLNIILMNYMGIHGIALSTSITLFIVVIIAYMILIKIIDYKDNFKITKNILLLLVTITVLFSLGQVLLSYTNISGLPEFVYVFLVSIVIVAFYLTILWIFRTREIESCFYIFIQLGHTFLNKVKPSRN